MSNPRDLSNPDCVKRIKDTAGLRHDLGTDTDVCLLTIDVVIFRDKPSYIVDILHSPFVLLCLCLFGCFHVHMFSIHTLATHCSSSVNRMNEYPTVVDICIQILHAHYFHQGSVLPRKVEMVCFRE